MEKFSPVCKTVCNAGAILNHICNMSRLYLHPRLSSFRHCRGQWGDPAYRGMLVREKFPGLSADETWFKRDFIRKREMYFMPARVTLHPAIFSLFYVAITVWIIPRGILPVFMGTSGMIGLSGTFSFHWIRLCLRIMELINVSCISLWYIEKKA